MNLNKYMVYPEEFNEQNLKKFKNCRPFAEDTLDFLSELSARLFKNPLAKTYPDVISLAFWLRRKSLERLKDSYGTRSGFLSFGRGLVFHIAPGNVALNFAYSLFTSMLAGNSNVIRLSTRIFPQRDVVLQTIKEICAMPNYKDAAESMAILQYPSDSRATGYLSSLCDVRIIWGGDDTIRNIRKHPIPPDSMELVFSDKYSFSAIKAEALCKHNDMERLADDFFNDTYLLDQNACSSPHMIVWTGSQEDILSAKNIFWKTVHSVVKKKYTMAPILAVEKLTQMFEDAINFKSVTMETDPDNLIMRVFMPKLPEGIEEVRTAGGYFIETHAPSLEDVAHIVNKRYQTLTYFGFSQEELMSFADKNTCHGLDRIVPFGQALSFETIWDGYDLINSLSRICRIRR